MYALREKQTNKLIQLLSCWIQIELVKQIVKFTKELQSRVEELKLSIHNGVIKVVLT